MGSLHKQVLGRRGVYPVDLLLLEAANLGGSFFNRGAWGIGFFRHVSRIADFRQVTYTWALTGFRLLPLHSFRWRHGVRDSSDLLRLFPDHVQLVLYVLNRLEQELRTVLEVTLHLVATRQVIVNDCLIVAIKLVLRFLDDLECLVQPLLSDFQLMTILSLVYLFYRLLI